MQRKGVMKWVHSIGGAVNHSHVVGVPSLEEAEAAVENSVLLETKVLDCWRFLVFRGLEASTTPPYRDILILVVKILTYGSALEL